MNDLEQDLLILQRIKLRRRLEAILIPAIVACWVALIWPAWLFPVLWYYRLKRFSEN